MNSRPQKTTPRQMPTPTETTATRMNRASIRAVSVLKWVAENREMLLAHALTILAAYQQAGQPDFKLKPWGSFESWSLLIRNAIVWCGLVDPGETRLAIQDQADETARGLSQLISALEMIDTHNVGMTATEIVSAVGEDSPHSAEVREMLRGALGSLISRLYGRAGCDRRVGHFLSV